jgi:hypothetical protein
MMQRIELSIKKLFDTLSAKTEAIKRHQRSLYQDYSLQHYYQVADRYPTYNAARSPPKRSQKMCKETKEGHLIARAPRGEKLLCRRRDLVSEPVQHGFSTLLQNGVVGNPELVAVNVQSSKRADM